MHTMPDLPTNVYSAHQIIVPPQFPQILKLFAKAAIKTQPYDLLRWSYEYFHALSESRLPPVKLRLDQTLCTSPGGLTVGYLKMFKQQFYGQETIKKSALQCAWLGACLDPAELERILCLCGAGSEDKPDVSMLAFFAVAAGMLTTSLTQTMILLCEILAGESDGRPASIPVADFVVMYQTLAAIDASCDADYVSGKRLGTESGKANENVEVKTEDYERSKHETVHVDAVRGIGAAVPTRIVAAAVKFVETAAARLDGSVSTDDIRHLACPPLEIYEDRNEIN